MPKDIESFLTEQALAKGDAWLLTCALTNGLLDPQR
jgi:hypothetical protein